LRRNKEGRWRETVKLDPNKKFIPPRASHAAAIILLAGTVTWIAFVLETFSQERSSSLTLALWAIIPPLAVSLLAGLILKLTHNPRI